MVRQLHATETLEDLLLKTIEETLNQVFKEAGTTVIYSFLETNNGLKREEIVEKAEVFSAGLETLIGSAAPVIEKAILKNLYRRVEVEFEEKPDYTFSDYVEDLGKGLRD